MANNISLSEILHKRPDVVPTIYGYILPDVKDHDGYIKTPKRVSANNCIRRQSISKYCSKNRQCAPTALVLPTRTCTVC